MKRSITILALVVVASNSMVLEALACNRVGGGYRFAAPRYSAPTFSHAPSYRHVVRPYRVRPTVGPVSFPSRSVAAPPQIRIAPTQRIQHQLQTQQNASQPSFAQAQQAQQPRTQTQQPQTQSPQTQPQPARTQPVQNSSQQSALALLAGRRSTTDTGTTNATPSNTVQQRAHVGRWTASLPNNTSVELRLENDGRFSWVANKGGKVSQFSGQFTLDGGVLTLNRSNDGQSLAGALTMNGTAAFNFKLNGAKDSGLNFNRQS